MTKLERFTMTVVLALAALAWILPIRPSAAQSTATTFGTVIVEAIDDEGGELPPGLKVFDGYDQVGVTDASGRVTLRMPAGLHRIGVLQPDYRAGKEFVEVVGFKTHSIQIRLKSSGLSDLFPRSIRFDQGPILSPDLKTLSGAVYDDVGRKVKLKELQIAFTSGDQFASISDKIELLPDGRFRTRPGSDLSALLKLDGTLKLRAFADVADGTGFQDEELKFVVGRHRVDGRIVAPPSQPDMKVAGLTLKAVLVAKDGEFTKSVPVRTAADGSFVLPNVPTGYVGIELEQFPSRGTFYRIDGTFFALSNTKILVRILSFADQDKGYKPIEVLSRARPRQSS